MTPACCKGYPLAPHHKARRLRGQVRFGSKSPLRSAVCSFHLGSVFKVRPGSSALPLTSYVLDPVSSPPRISCGIPPARQKGGQFSVLGRCFLPRHPCRCLLSCGVRKPGQEIIGGTNKKAAYNCNPGSNLAKYPSHREHLVRRNRMCKRPQFLLLATATAPVYQTVDGRFKSLAESVGIEPTHRLPDDGLASRCLNHSANFPWRKAEESNPIPVRRTRFSRPVAGPSPLHHLPKLGAA